MAHEFLAEAAVDAVQQGARPAPLEHALRSIGVAGFVLQAGFPEERTHLIHYGVDHDSFRVLGIPKSPTPLIGLVGRLKKYKSVDHLLEAFVIVRAR